MKYNNITTENTEFILLSFEGPDCYSSAGGLGVRVQNLSRTLAQVGFTTHLFFIGDPDLAGEEKLEEGRLILHRWCQWISKYHPGGVYDGEEGKLSEFNYSIPGYILTNIIQPASAAGKLIVILGEEWQMAEVMCNVSDALHNSGLRNNTILFWNANNTFSFHRINWGRLSYATTITTISRYMKHIMERMGLSTLVIPNGIPRALLRRVDDQVADNLRSKLGGGLLLTKVARWDPDKRWIQAVEATAKLRDMGLKTLLLARGGREPYGGEVIARALALKLSVKDAWLDPDSPDDFLTPLIKVLPADMINIQYQLPLDFLATLYRASDAVMANSAHEPFGIVGLEAMAAGGIVFTGSTGEDYSISFVNSFMIETPDPLEMVSYIIYLRNYLELVKRMRVSARYAAHNFTWEAAVLNLIGKLENQGRIQGALSNEFSSLTSQTQPAESILAQRVRQFPDQEKIYQELINSRCLS